MDSKFNSQAQELNKAVLHHDVDTSIRLLQDAGGSCQARELASAASNILDPSEPSTSSFGYSISVDTASNTETLSLYCGVLSWGIFPVASLTQPECKT
jgi:hypothetical protein